MKQKTANTRLEMILLREQSSSSSSCSPQSNSNVIDNVIDKKLLNYIGGGLQKMG